MKPNAPFHQPGMLHRSRERLSSPGGGRRRPDCDVLIVGGGPVGLLLSNLLGQRGVRTWLVEQRTEPPVRSMAIGITPPSLAILKRLALDTTFCRAGVPIRTARVHEGRDPLGRVDFNGLPSDFPFILSLPQATTVRILQENLARFPNVGYRGGVEFISLAQDAQGATVRLCERSRDIAIEVRARYVVGCDGHRSAIRRALGIPCREKTYRPWFVMADFEDRTDLGTEAHLFFTAQASVESFPLPGGRRRWIVLADKTAETNPAAYLVGTVRRLTGYELGDTHPCFLSTFRTKRSLSARYHEGRVLLCGDAAHLMSPIGGQGMNTGFGDAELLAEVLGRALETPSLEAELFALYDRARRRAFTVAADRAARGMWLGTRRGRVASALRKWFLRAVLFQPPLHDKLAPYFAMLTIPFHTAAQVVALPPAARSGPGVRL